MENINKNDLLKLPTDSYLTFDMSVGIKDEKFHTFLTENFGDKATPFIAWAKNTKLDNKITPSKLEKMILLYEGAVDFDLATKAVYLDPEVKNEILNVFENKQIDIPSNKNSLNDISEGIKDGNFHIVLKEQFGDKANPFIEWAKNTKLDNKITPSKLEKIILLYEGKIEFDLATKAVPLDQEVKNEILNVFEGKIIAIQDSNKSTVVKSEGIKDENFHIFLKKQFGDKANPFIDWANNTSLDNKTTPRQLEKIILLYEGSTEFNLVSKALSLDAEVEKEIFNIFDSNIQSSKNKPKM